MKTSIPEEVIVKLEKEAAAARVRIKARRAKSDGERCVTGQLKDEDCELRQMNSRDMVCAIHGAVKPRRKL